MSFEKRNSSKDFMLPSLPTAKCSLPRAVTVEKRSHGSHRLSSPSPYKTLQSSVPTSETHTKLKHLIPPYVSAKTWAVYNTITGQILFSQGAEERREIASLTKIMTCYLSLKLAEKYNLPLSKLVTVSARASRISGTSANLQVGDELSIQDLIYGLMLPSGNDAAYALGEFFGTYLGGIKPVRAFVVEMNKMAEEIGLKNTKFRNPHGMSLRPNFSTAKDVCIMASHALMDKLFSDVVNTKEYTCKVSKENSREITWKSTNKLLGKGVDGVKTGQTPRAGNCLCARFVYGKVPLIITVLACKTKNSRWVEVPRLAEWTYSKI